MSGPSLFLLLARRLSSQLTSTSSDGRTKVLRNNAARVQLLQRFGISALIWGQLSIWCFCFRKRQRVKKRVARSSRDQFTCCWGAKQGGILEAKFKICSKQISNGGVEREPFIWCLVVCDGCLALCWGGGGLCANCLHIYPPFLCQSTSMAVTNTMYTRK